MTDSEMESLLGNIAQMAAVVYAKEPHWNRKTMELLSPALTQDITKFSKRFAVPLPASYSQFLRLHNGCLNFWPALTLLGTEGKTPAKDFASDGEGGYLRFNPKKKTKDGEPEVIHYSADGQIEDRYPNFAAFLGTTAYILQTRILDKGYSAAKQRQVKGRNK